MNCALRTSYFYRLFVCITFFVSPSFAQSERYCSNGPSLHLNENFTTNTLAVSALSYKQEDLKELVKSLLSQNNTPQIIVYDGSNKSGSIFESLSQDLKSKWLKHVTIFQDTVTWSQDFFESFNTKSGSPFIRLVNGYKKQDSHYNDYLVAQGHLTEKLKVLGIDTREAINPEGKTAKNGHKGGNLESTNEGYCLIGDSDLSDSELSELVNQNCGGIDNAIILPTHWLPAKHVDELIKQLPSQSQEPCVAKFAISSSEKTLDLLESNPEELFFGSNSISDTTKMYDRSALSAVCANLLNQQPNIIKHALKAIDNYEPVFPQEGYIAYRLPFAKAENLELYKKCFEIKNKDVLHLLKNDQGYKYSLGFSKQMTMAAKKKIVNFYAQKRPDCKVSFVDMPTLFSVNTSRYFTDDRSRSIEITQSEAILPNQINNLKVGDDIFIPQSGNAAIERYIEDLYRKVGLTPHFLSTFDLHISGGNVHCSSQTIHSCVPLDSF